jgi:hypothetical protein
VAGRLSARQTLLRRSIQAALATPGRLRVVIGSNLPWARITHYGGVIRPSDEPSADVARRRVGGKPKYLTIPLGEAKGRRARDYQDLFRLKGRNGKLYLAQKLTQASSLKTRKTSSGFAGSGSRKLEGTGAAKKSGFRLVGDVKFDEVAPKCSWISPVPGGVGPMTITSLLVNTLKAAGA